MKKTKYLGYTLVLFLFFGACEQEKIDLQPADPDTTNIGAEPNCTGASPGTANFTKFVTIGSSFTSGFQAGALFNEGQNNSLGQILANQFTCVGGGTFNQPSIKSENGFNIFITPNPLNGTILGRFKLQGTPPAPAPVISGTEAIPNPMVNPGFIYTGSSGAVSVNQLNNFGVQAIVIGQALITQTGNWTLAGADPRFNPFYARFASDGGTGTSTLLGDAITSLANGGTFFMFWLGMDDVLLHAVYGGDPTKAPLTSVTDFANQYNFAVASILGSNTTVNGVIATYPDILVMPHFTSVPWNAIEFAVDDEAIVNNTNAAYTPYNTGLETALAGGYPGLTQSEVDRRKIAFVLGKNGIVLEDETLTDLSALGLPSIRQATASDLFPLSAGTVLGVQATPGDPSTTWGVGKALTDQYALTPSEIQQINTRLNDFNAVIKTVAEGTNSSRLALADVNQHFKTFLTAQASIVNGVTITPNINPPTGIYSEEGLHPNSRGYAFIANIFIDAINAKFGATIPKANLSKYNATGLPINP